MAMSRHMLRVSSTCLVVLDRNRYSVPAANSPVGAVSVRSTATEIRIVADSAVIAEHARRFGARSTDLRSLALPADPGAQTRRVA